MSKEVQSLKSTAHTEGDPKRVGLRGPITDEDLITNNFDTGFDDDLNAIFGDGGLLERFQLPLLSSFMV